MIVDVDGLAAHAATGGVELNSDSSNSADPVMILIHGAGMDSTVWQQQTRFLAHRNLRAVAVDLPGHGRSEGEPLTTIVDMAHWVARFIEAANLAPAHIAGHSMGTFIALELNRHHSELVSSLTLMGTAVGMPVHPELISTSENELAKAAALMASWSHAKPAHIGLNPTPGLWMLGGARALVETSEPGALTADFNACASYTDAIDAAKAATCPVHVVIGLDDKMTPAKSAAKLVAEMDQNQLTVTKLADTGHMMMIEDPRSTRQLLLDTVL
ncbi:MAG: alpha/beta fold hydrolase [Acidimicrobiales bacterium]